MPCSAHRPAQAGGGAGRQVAAGVGQGRLPGVLRDFIHQAAPERLLGGEGSPAEEQILGASPSHPLGQKDRRHRSENPENDFRLSQLRLRRCDEAVAESGQLDARPPGTGRGPPPGSPPKRPGFDGRVRGSSGASRRTVPEDVPARSRQTRCAPSPSRTTALRPGSPAACSKIEERIPDFSMSRMLAFGVASTIRQIEPPSSFSSRTGPGAPGGPDSEIMALLPGPAPAGRSCRPRTHWLGKTRGPEHCSAPPWS